MYHSHKDVGDNKMDKHLSSIFYDPGNPAGFSTVAKLYNASKRLGYSYSKDEVERWLLAQDTYTLYKPQRRNFPTRRVKTMGVDDIHQADLADMSRHAKYNDGIHFLLCIIDTFS